MRRCPTRRPRAAPQAGQAGRATAAATGRRPADLKTSPPERQRDDAATRRRAPRRRQSTSLAWVDQRTGATGFLTGMLYRKVPKGTNWFYTLGSATLFAFIVQAVTGVFLAMFYTPSPTQAYASIAHINNDVFLGEFVHGMHKWGSSVMVILIFLHMGADLLLRRLQVPARAQLGDRRRAADPDDDDGLHRLPAALRPALLLGLGRRHQHQRHRPRRRPLPERLPARRRRSSGATTLSRFYAIHMLLVPGRDHRPDRRPPVPGGQARHHGAALGAGREAQGRRAGRPARRRRRGQRRRTRQRSRARDEARATSRHTSRSTSS